jgi:NTP pyrophosphatase (non-canonical NTP hydrolase)
VSSYSSDLQFPSLRRLQHEVEEWTQHNFPEETADDVLLGALEELGELAHAHLKVKQGIRNNENHEAKAKDAIGDVLICLSAFCSQKGYNLQDCVWDAWHKVKKRDWKNNPDTAHEATK